MVLRKYFNGVGFSEVQGYFGKWGEVEYRE